MIKPSLQIFADRAGAPEAEAVLSVVIVYDDLSAGKRAMLALDGSVCEFAAAFQFQPQFWRVDFLEDPSWREFATPDVVNADMVLISISSKDALPEWFRGWLCACLSQKRETRGAVVALLVRGDASEAPVVGQLPWLEEATREAGWDFISSLLYENGFAASLAESVERSEQRPRRSEESAEIFRSVFPEALNRATAYRHWGINE